MKNMTTSIIVLVMFCTVGWSVAADGEEEITILNIEVPTIEMQLVQYTAITISKGDFEWKSETMSCFTREQLITLSIIASLHYALEMNQVKEMLKDMPTCPNEKDGDQ